MNAFSHRGDRIHLLSVNIRNQCINWNRLFISNRGKTNPLWLLNFVINHFLLLKSRKSSRKKNLIPISIINRIKLTMANTHTSMKLKKNPQDSEENVQSQNTTDKSVLRCYIIARMRIDFFQTGRTTWFRAGASSTNLPTETPHCRAWNAIYSTVYSIWFDSYD